MPDLGNFSNRIRRVGDDVEDGANRVVRQAAIAVNQTVTLATPVDTGRARANWQVGIGAPVLEATEDTDKDGGPTINRNNAKIALRQERQTVYISNNVPYIGRLNAGSSAKAPAGFVEEAVSIGVSAIQGARVLR